MIAILLVALFATVALASVATLADAIVRSRIALRQLRGDLVRNDLVRMVTVTMDGGEDVRMPALRAVPVSAGRRSPRRTLRSPAPLRAAA